MSVQYVVDEQGRLTRVVLPIEEYNRLLDKLEESENIVADHKTRAALKKSEKESIPFEQALREIQEDQAPENDS